MSSPPPADRKRVLIVDDDRALRHALATLLQGKGYAVEQGQSSPMLGASAAYEYEAATQRRGAYDLGTGRS